jgi:hypothetical protein
MWVGKAQKVWDEAMLSGDVVSLSTDQLASLREPFRQAHPSLAELVDVWSVNLRPLVAKGASLGLMLKRRQGSGS